MVGINALIGYVTESQSERIIRSLQQGQENTARVMRDGQAAWVDAAEIVPGDVLFLQVSGQTVVADARLIHSENLTVDESTLTGGKPAGEQTSAARFPLEAPLAEQK